MQWAFAMYCMAQGVSHGDINRLWGEFEDRHAGDFLRKEWSPAEFAFRVNLIVNEHKLKKEQGVPIFT